MQLPRIMEGTGPASWLFYFALAGAFLYVFLPEENLGLIGILSGIFVPLRIEMNSLKARIRRLEAADQPA